MDHRVHTRRAGTLALGILTGLAVGTAHAATYTVDRLDDDAAATSCGALAGDCSLRGAIIRANGNASSDLILVPAGSYVLSIAGQLEDAAASGDLDVTSEVEIRGDGAATTIVDADDLDRVFHVVAPGQLTISGLTIRNGTSTGGSTPSDGGAGILNEGTVVVRDVTLEDNDANTAAGGGLRSGLGKSCLVERVLVQRNLAKSGGGMHLARCEVRDSVVVENDATQSGGGIMTAGGVFEQQVSIFDSTIADNSSLVYGGGLFATGSTLVVDGSTLSGNYAGPGLASATGGGGLVSANSFVEIVNSTLSGNDTSGSGGATQVSGSQGSFLLRNVTVSGNTDGYGDTRSLFQVSSTTTFENSIVDGRCSVGNLGAAFVSLGGNVESPVSTCAMSSTGDQNNVPAAALALGPLDDNGGATLTHAIGAASAARNAGLAANCPATDQRGEPRADGLCDAGAYETSGPLCTDDDGDGFSVQGGACGVVDCDDGDPAVNPGAAERCNGIDDDCAGGIDDAFPLLDTSCAVGVGACEESGTVVCSADELGTECDATPGEAGVEGPYGDPTCGNAIDDDCDGATDELDGDCELLCTDGDGDGFSTEGGDCGPVDCDDGDPAVNPGAAEIPGNGVDDDCDPTTPPQSGCNPEPASGR